MPPPCSSCSASKASDSATDPSRWRLVNSHQSATVLAHFTSFMGLARDSGVDDRALAEWLLSLSARWLHAHGYSHQSLQQWVQHEIERPRPTPLTAAGRAAKDFGERR